MRGWKRAMTFPWLSSMRVTNSGEIWIPLLTNAV